MITQPWQPQAATDISVVAQGAVVVRPQFNGQGWQAFRHRVAIAIGSLLRPEWLR